jgi:hypothetical protein
MFKPNPPQGLDALAGDLDYVDMADGPSDSELRTVQHVSEALALPEVLVTAYGDVRQERHISPEVWAKRAIIEPVMEGDELVTAFLRHEKHMPTSGDAIGTRLRAAKNKTDRPAFRQSGGCMLDDELCRHVSREDQREVCTDPSSLGIMALSDRLDPLVI